jgi:hypothetical protein
MINEKFGWATILVGFLSGIWFGLNFHKDAWLGGYASFQRRLIRLGHVAVIALGAINILYAHSAARLDANESQLAQISWLLMIGAVTMPLCCVLTAWNRKFQPTFVIPVASLIAGVGCIVFRLR